MYGYCRETSNRISVRFTTFNGGTLNVEFNFFEITIISKRQQNVNKKNLSEKAGFSLTSFHIAII